MEETTQKVDIDTFTQEWDDTMCQRGKPLEAKPWEFANSEQQGRGSIM